MDIFNAHSLSAAIFTSKSRTCNMGMFARPRKSNLVKAQGWRFRAASS